jgi:uncharacterized protein
MTIVNQLFALQEVDLQIEAREKAVNQMTAELGESDVLRSARGKFTEEQKHLNDLLSDQRSLDLEIDGLSNKLADLEKDLYSGKIKVFKELGNLQQEIASLKSKRIQLEDKSLGLMEQIESGRAAAAGLAAELKEVEAVWQARQKELKQTIESEKQMINGLLQKQKDMVSSIEASALQIYQTVKKRRGYAVARIEQGICRGCRISLPANELQNARGGRLVQCSSCGRILYQP